MADTGLGNIRIKVAPEELLSKAQEVTRNTQSLKRHFDSLKKVIDKTQRYWIGDAGSSHRTAYTELTKNIEELLTRLNKHPGEFETIAKNYIDTEKIIEERVTKLPTNIIS